MRFERRDIDTFKVLFYVITLFVRPQSVTEGHYWLVRNIFAFLTKMSIIIYWMKLSRINWTFYCKNTQFWLSKLKNSKLKNCSWFSTTINMSFLGIRLVLGKKVPSWRKCFWKNTKKCNERNYIHEEINLRSRLFSFCYFDSKTKLRLDLCWKILELESRTYWSSSSHHKYQVVRVSPGGSFAPFPPSPLLPSPFTPFISDLVLGSKPPAPFTPFHPLLALWPPLPPLPPCPFNLD